MVSGQWWVLQTLQLFELCCFGVSLHRLDLSFGYLWKIPLISTFTGFGVANTYILVTFWNFSQTKEENRIPNLNPSQGWTFQPKLSRLWARSNEQCSSAAFLSDYITSQCAGVHLPSSRAQQPLSSLSASAAEQPASAGRKLSSIFV